ncbi:hypothetical protein ABPG77_010543 [Micractinium sp. CCAP 211/92]
MNGVTEFKCSQNKVVVEVASAVQPPFKKARAKMDPSLTAATAPAPVTLHTERVEVAAPETVAAELTFGEGAAEAAAPVPSGSCQPGGALAGSIATSAAAGGSHAGPSSSPSSPAGGTCTGSHPVRLLSPLQLNILMYEAQKEVLRIAFPEPLPQEIGRHLLQRALRMCRSLRHPPPMEDPSEQHHFSVLSYNIWYDPTMGPERMAAIGRLIQHDCHLPDFVLLQEVTHHYYLALAAQPFWRHYNASPMPPPIKLPGWGPDIPSPVFTVILWRRDRVAGGRYEPAHAYVNASMPRDQKSVVCSIGGTRLQVSTTHLERPLGGPQRTNWTKCTAQHDEMMALLDARQEPNSVVAGDMNWVSMRGEDVPWPLPPGWQDVWLALRPRERGWTWDTHACPQKGRKYKDGARLDRMFCRLADWEPVGVERVGMEPIPGVPPRVIRTGKTARSDKPVPTWPSDHFGLHALFVRRGVLGVG